MGSLPDFRHQKHPRLNMETEFSFPPGSSRSISGSEIGHLATSNGIRSSVEMSSEGVGGEQDTF